jgi:quinol monooxygenase YgiN
MYGLIGRIIAATGRRQELIDAMLTDMAPMPGCLSYVIARDPSHDDAIWITEVWDNAESHAASLSLPAVQELIGRVRPLIAGFDNRHETQPLGGLGI